MSTSIEEVYTEQKRRRFALYRAGVIDQIGKEVGELLDNSIVVRPLSRAWHADNHIKTCAHPISLPYTYSTVDLPIENHSK